MLKLVIGNKNYSSWSMRPWVLLRHFKVDFEEIRIPLFTETYRQELAEYSPTLRVPVLIDGDVTIWDSMAICEYISDRYLDMPALPEDPVRRGLCRAYCAEMHGGFFALRQQMPMNCRSRRRIAIDEELRSEIARIESLWTEALQANRDAGPYLFGDFSMADAFFAPVVMRFRTYGVELPQICSDYMSTVVQNRAVYSWVTAACEESESLPDYHLGEELTG